MFDEWPALPYSQWSDTCETLHMWTQVVGKIRMTKTPPVNHWWHVPLYVTSRGARHLADPGRRAYVRDRLRLRRSSASHRHDGRRAARLRVAPDDRRRVLLARDARARRAAHRRDDQHHTIRGERSDPV